MILSLSIDQQHHNSKILLLNFFLFKKIISKIKKNNKNIQNKKLKNKLVIISAIKPNKRIFSNKL